MLLVQDASISPAEQEALSEALVAQGCRYAVCAGHNCSSWDDSIDQAFLQTDPNFDPPDARFVMTTWHDDEPLDEVTWFFLWNTEYDSHVPRRFLAAVLGGDDRFTQQVIDALVRNAARSDGA